MTKLEQLCVDLTDLLAEGSDFSEQLEVCGIQHKYLTHSLEVDHPLQELVALLRYKDRPLSNFRLREWPGNPDLIISHGVYVFPEYQSKGVGGILHRLRLAALKRTEYHAVLATVNIGNNAELHILQSNKWNLAYSVTPFAKLFIRTFDHPTE